MLRHMAANDVYPCVEAETHQASVMGWEVEGGLNAQFSSWVELNSLGLECSGA